MAANESTRERIEKMSIILDHVNYVYGADTPLAVHALNDVCLKIPDDSSSVSLGIPVPVSPR